MIFDKFIPVEEVDSLREKKIKVPEGMLKAGLTGWNGCDAGYHDQSHYVAVVLEAALRWLSENPLCPDDFQIGEMLTAKKQFIDSFEPGDWLRWGASEWQRRMFLQPEPEEGISDQEALSALATYENSIRCGNNKKDAMSSALAWLEAFRRGQKAAK